MAPNVQDPPVFHGEPGRDDLPAVLHDFKNWYISTKSASGLDGERLYDIMAKAFPFRSPASKWFEANDSGIRAAAAIDTHPDALFDHTMNRLTRAFEFISGDVDTQLEGMKYRPPQNIATFAANFYALAVSGRVNDPRAMSLLINAYELHAPELSQALLRERMSTDEPTLQKLVAVVERLNRHHATFKPVRSVSPKRDSGASSASQPVVQYVKPPCPLEGHGSHSMDECRKLKEMVKQASVPKRTPPKANTTVTKQVNPLEQKIDQLSNTVAALSMQGPPAYAHPASSQDARSPGYAPFWRPPPAMAAMSNPSMRPPPQRPVRQPCMQCGRVHPPPCYGRNFEHAPPRQVHATPDPHMHSTYEFASNADLQ